MINFLSKRSKFMESKEILSAIEEATTTSSMEKVNFKDGDESKSDYYYSKDESFLNPLLIRGINKQLILSENLVSFEDGVNCSVEELITLCNNVDNQLEMQTIENISDLEMSFVNDSYMVLVDTGFNDLEEVGRYYIIPFNCTDTKKELAAFRRWSELLKVPYSYSKKNPGFLNETNFQYWKTFLTTAKDQQVPVDILYMKESMKITLKENSIPVEAYLVVNLFRSEVVCERRGVISEVIHSEAINKVPFLSRILNNVQKQVVKNNPNIKLRVQQYSLGYTGTNKGRHYARLLLEDTGVDFEINGDKYIPAITIESDFIGKCGDFGNVIITFGLFRILCSNGVVVSWTEKQKESVREKFVFNYCNNRGVVSERDEFYLDTINEANSKFSTLFSMNGIKLPVNIANSVFAETLFNQIFEYYMGSMGFMEGSLKDLSFDSFEQVDEKKFVATAHNLASSMRMPMDVIKYFIIEYLVGNFKFQTQIFNTSYDVVNFLTYICRAFDSSIQLDIEKKAYLFAATLAQILIHKKKSDNSIYENYLRRINTENLS